jgi:hypothetical protein
MRDLRLLALAMAAYMLAVPTCIGVVVWREGASTSTVVGGFSLASALGLLALAVMQALVMYDRRAGSEAAHRVNVGLGGEKA